MAPTVESQNYVKKALGVTLTQNQEAHRLSGLVRAGVPPLKNDKELDAFFTEVTGKGYPHPWRGLSVGRILSKLSPMAIIRAMAEDGRMFSSDVDIYEWLLYEVAKKLIVSPMRAPRRVRMTRMTACLLTGGCVFTK